MCYNKNMNKPKNVTTYNINKIPEIHFLGRNFSGAEKLNYRQLFWHGSGFEVHFEGQELWALMEADYVSMEPWIAVYLNGRINSRQMITKGKQWICLARGFDEYYKTDIRVIKDTQPQTDDFYHSLKIHKLAVSKGGKFSPLPDHKMKIEFIGDSITTGEGLYGAIGDMDWVSCHMSFCKTYAYQTADLLDADFRVMSQGGYGIVTGYNNSPYKVIPPHYENVCSIVGGPVYAKNGGNLPYDFLSWQPDVIVVYLGTNDRGSLYFEPFVDEVTGIEYKHNLGPDGKASEQDAEEIAGGTKTFLSIIRKNNPKAKIIWATGMMDIPEVMPAIYAGIEEYKNYSGDKNIYTIDFESMDCEVLDEDKGSRGHPGPKTHNLAAKKLADFINNLQ